MTSKKILCITTSPLPYGSNITDGPGYRAWNLFQQLSERYRVAFLSLNESFHKRQRQEHEVVENGIRVRCVSYGPNRIAKIVKEEAPDTLYLHWSSLPFLSGTKQKIPTIIDYVGTGLLENYSMLGRVPEHLLRLKLSSFWQGDFLMTAGMRERYYLLGLLVASRKLCFKVQTSHTPAIHFIPMIPPKEAPKATTAVMDKNDDFIVLVAGALLPWYDYPTLFEALRLLIRRGQTHFKVFFMGGKSQHAGYDSTFLRVESYIKTHLSGDLGNKVVLTGHVPFRERANYYLTADVGVNIGSNTLENEIATRTRIVDYLWGRLPLITSGGDEYSELVLKEGAGFQYTAHEPASLADLLENLMKDQQIIKKTRGNIQSLLEKNFNVRRVASSLVEFVDNPHIDPTRKSLKRFAPKLFLQIRDLLNLS